MRPISFACGLALALALSATPLQAKSGFTVLDTFGAPDAELTVAAYSEPDKGEAGPRVTLIGIANGDHRNSMGFRRPAWNEFLALWGRTPHSQSAWTTVGSISETETSDISTLTVSSGPEGVRFQVSSPKQGTVTYVLPTSEDARFERALATATAELRP